MSSPAAPFTTCSTPTVCARSFDRFEKLLTDAERDADELEQLRQELESDCPVRLPALRPLSGNWKRPCGKFEQTGGQPPLYLAVRSSAQEEDMDFSFAGQLHSVLQVKAAPENIFHAYREVAASLFNLKAIRYRQQLFPEGGQLSIAALCQRMIDSRASGIIYSDDPSEPFSRSMLAVGSFGQGQAVVEGQVPTDSFRIAKNDGFRITDRVIARKS